MMTASCVRRSPFFVIVAALAGSCVASAAEPAKEAPKDSSPLYVHIETRAPLSYSGDKNEVTILFKNEGTENWTNPGMEIESGFQVFDSNGNKLERSKSVPASAKDGQPRVLEPNGYFGKIIDLSALFPKISAIDTYKITWSGPGIPEKAIMHRVIKKYDSARDYQAVISTEFGNIVLEFYDDLAPMHVKNFIDLANQGFYDGKLFHRTIKGEVAFAGSPTNDERGGPGYTLPPEPNGLKVLPGSVAQVRNSMSGAEESGSIFLIATVPKPDMDTHYTVFARVTEGLDTVKAITNLPTAGAGGARAAMRPIRDVVMKKVEIREKKGEKTTGKSGK